MNIACVHTYNYSGQPFTIELDFNGGIYWSDLLKGAATFRRNTV